MITQRTSQKTTEAFKEETEATETSGATWFGWCVAQTAGEFREERGCCCCCCKLVMLFRFR